MQNSSTIQIILIFIPLVILILGTCAYFGIKLANKHPSDVRVICYLLSLSFVTTCVLAFWASSIKAIDSTGEFQGHWGGILNALLHFMLDLETDISILVAILVIFVVPQATTYVLSGFLGCASAPIFVGRAVGFFIWGVVKSFIVASGILLAISIYSLVDGWTSWTIKGVVSMLTLSIMLLLIAFVCLYMYRDASASTPAPNERAEKIQGRLRKLHAWFTRKSNTDDTANPSFSGLPPVAAESKRQDQ